VRRELNVLALVKGQERYVFVYDDHCRNELVDVFRQYATDPKLTFNWFDAAVLTEKARQQAAENAKGANEPRPPSRLAGA
jgi:hypothetical protein